LIKDIEKDLTLDCLDQASRVKKIIETSGKLLLIDKLLDKFKKEKKKVIKSIIIET
jgi:chromodomain-helicase-DNA-binding protein 7